MKLTGAQRLALEVLVEEGGEVDCGKFASQRAPVARVNTMVAHNLCGLGLAKLVLGYGGRFRFRATDAGREMVADG